MEIHPNMERLRLQRVLPERAAEQSFELDYLLADYLPDIFKIIQCDVLPFVTETTVSEGRMTVDLELEIRILYLSEPKHELCIITQKQQMQKQCELSDLPENGMVTVSVRPDQCRCRAVNPRRVDLRGALILKLEPECSETVQYLDGRQKDPSLQLKTEECDCLTGKEQLVQELSITERSLLPYGKPAADTIYLYRITPIVKEARRAGDRIVCKGSLRLHLLYRPQQTEQETMLPQSAEFMIPVDAVIHAGKEIADAASLQASIEVTGVELSVDTDAKDPAIEGQYRLKITVSAPESGVMRYVSDLYSTKYPVKMQTEEISCLAMQAMVDRVSVCRNLISVSGGGISQVVDLFAEIKGTSLRIGENGAPVLTVNLQLDLFAVDENGMLFHAERLIPCELYPEVSPQSEEAYFDPEVSILSESYRITESGELEVQTELQLRGVFCSKQKIRVVVGVTAEEGETDANPEASLHLYYGKAGEDLWEVAKSFRTDHAMMLIENDLTGDLLTEDRMLLIPMA